MHKVNEDLGSKNTIWTEAWAVCAAAVLAVVLSRVADHAEFQRSDQNGMRGATFFFFAAGFLAGAAFFAGALRFFGFSSSDSPL